MKNRYSVQKRRRPGWFITIRSLPLLEPSGTLLTSWKVGWKLQRKRKKQGKNLEREKKKKKKNPPPLLWLDQSDLWERFSCRSVGEQNSPVIQTPDAFIKGKWTFSDYLGTWPIWPVSWFCCSRFTPSNHAQVTALSLSPSLLFLFFFFFLRFFRIFATLIVHFCCYFFLVCLGSTHLFAILCCRRNWDRSHNHNLDS